MISKNKNKCTWSFWLSYSTTEKKDSQYNSNLIKIHTLANLADFAYVWENSPISHPQKFFTNPSSFQYTMFKIEEELKKVDSISLFKNDIEPTWQYGDNLKGGYFNFSLLKTVSGQIVKKVYENLIFMVIGSALSICDRIKGIRVVDTVGKNSFRCRFQIWMDYNKEMQAQREQDEAELIKFLLSLEEDALKKVFLNFFNIGGKKVEKNDAEK